MIALEYADLTFGSRGRVWGPIGRFGWKYSGRHNAENPFDDLVKEAELQKDDWGPLRAGFFLGSSKRFAEIANGYREIVDGLRWF